MSDPFCSSGCGREASDWKNCLRKTIDCPNRAPPARSPRHVITITNPGYDIVLFFRDDRSAQAIISAPDGKPTSVYVAPPEPGRQIVIERREGVLDVLYKDAPHE